MQNQLETMFERMGARVRVRDTFSGNRGGIDIRSDRHGEYFDIGVGATERVEYEVIDIQPRLRHLLLMARRERANRSFFAVTTSDIGSFALFRAHRCRTYSPPCKLCNHRKCARPSVAKLGAPRTVSVVATKHSCGRANGSSFPLLSYPSTQS